jgi:hypothetical protein
MNPKTQSVCKHCQQEISKSVTGWRITKRPYALFCHAEMMPGQMHEPVAEPASTGEPELIATMVYNHDEQTVTVEWPARPSEPSAPRKMIDVGGKEHDETTQCKYSDCKPAPQTSAEHCKNCGQLEVAHFGIPRYCYPYKHPDWKEDLVFTFAQPVSAPSPTPSLSTEPQAWLEFGPNTPPREGEYQVSIKDNQRYFTYAKAYPFMDWKDGKWLWDSGDGDPLQDFTTEVTHYRASPSVAGTQPTPDKLRKLADWLKDWEIVGAPEGNTALRVAIDQLFDPEENRAILDLFGAAQGTPQVEEKK